MALIIHITKLTRAINLVSHHLISHHLISHHLISHLLISHLLISHLLGIPPSTAPWAALVMANTRWALLGQESIQVTQITFRHLISRHLISHHLVIQRRQRQPPREGTITIIMILLPQMILSDHTK